MKREISLLLSLLATTFCAFSQSALSVADTRDMVTSPISYNRSFQVHFKRNTAIGLPVAPYSTILGLRGWQDDSGGKAHELAFTNTDLYLRSGLNNGWEGWRKILVENIDGDVGVGTVTPASKLDIRGSLTIDNATDAYVFTGTGNAELNRYLTLLNSSASRTASGLKAGGILIADSYAYANPGKNDLVVKGSVSVGVISSQGHKLAVAGSVIAESVTVKLKSAWPDYVFDDNYKMKSLSEIESFVNENKHLPGIPSKKEVEAEGVNLGEMNRKLLEKVEELTLHLIEKDKLLTDVVKRLEQLEKNKN
jgi:hypothetical protein